MPEPLPREFYERDTETVARALLGCRLFRRLAAGGVAETRIVETEAYVGPHDLAAHTSKGRTPRNEVMWGPAGHTYVYLVYGMHHCLNFVTEPAGHGAAVLLRGLEAVDGLPFAARLDGPARLTRVLDIARADNGLDLVAGEGLWVEGPTRPVRAVSVGPRIGVAYAGEWAHKPLRFWETGSEGVSPAGGARRRRARAE